jgi:hypothetical protein
MYIDGDMRVGKKFFDTDITRYGPLIYHSDLQLPDSLNWPIVCNGHANA